MRHKKPFLVAQVSTKSEVSYFSQKTGCPAKIPDLAKLNISALLKMRRQRQLYVHNFALILLVSRHQLFHRL